MTLLYQTGRDIVQQNLADRPVVKADRLAAERAWDAVRQNTMNASTALAALEIVMKRSGKRALLAVLEANGSSIQLGEALDRMRDSARVTLGEGGYHSARRARTFGGNLYVNRGGGYTYTSGRTAFPRKWRVGPRPARTK